MADAFATVFGSAMLIVSLAIMGIGVAMFMLVGIVYVMVRGLFVRCSSKVDDWNWRA